MLLLACVLGKTNAAEPAVDELRYLRAKLEFLEARRDWPGLSITEWNALPEKTQWAMLTDGASELKPDTLHRPTRAPEEPPSSTIWQQVGGGEKIHRLVEFNGPRPVWSSVLVQAMMRAQDEGLDKLSPFHYANSATDIAMAIQSFLPSNGAARDETVGVFSSITPWVELTLLKVLGSRAKSITTIDYNPPVVDAAKLRRKLGTRMPLRVLPANELGERYARGEASFSLIVAFSGIEHDGLGRYGDPINPNGDLAAMREMRLTLRDGGLLLLAVPTCSRDELQYPGHRQYGPVRLPKLLAGFKLLGRVRHGQLVRGGLETADATPGLYRPVNRWKWQNQNYSVCESWRYQPVLVLQKV